MNRSLSISSFFVVVDIKLPQLCQYDNKGRGTIKIGAPENRIINTYQASVLTPRDNDLFNPVPGLVLTAPSILEQDISGLSRNLHCSRLNL
jgi:hypothetical protein